MATQQLCGAAALALLGLLLAGCGRGHGLHLGGLGNGTPALVGDGPSSPPKVTAEWLRQQPGRTVGEFSFHLLDADNYPLPWRGLSVVVAPARPPSAVIEGKGLLSNDDSATGNNSYSFSSAEEGRAGATTTEFTISATGDPPADAYIYITYPYARYALDYARLDESRSADYILIAAAGRVPDVLPVGIARIGGTGGSAGPDSGQAQRPAPPLPPGPLLRIRFAPGIERSFRSVSSVSDDPKSAAVLSTGTVGSNTVQLEWDERNVGDYDNNGLVTISDITPLGANFSASVNGDPKLLLIDGDENGLLTIADLSKIGRNFGTQIQGYVVYAATGIAPPPAQFAPVSSAPTLARSAVFTGTPVSLRKQRLHYSYVAATAPGTDNNYYVKPWSHDGGADSFGPASNTVVYTAPAGNQPPVWDTTSGVTAVSGLTNGLRISFGHATDPEGESVDYVLRYIVSPGLVDSGSATEVILPPATTSGSPPYTYDLTGLTPGTTYNLRLRARDPEGALTSNTNAQSGKVPLLGVSSDPWPYPDGDLQGSMSSPATNPSLPLEFEWGDVTGSSGDALISSLGWIWIPQDIDGGSIRYSIGTGMQILPKGPACNGKASLSGNTLAGPLDPSYYTSVFDFATSSTTFTTSTPGYCSLILGDYVLNLPEDHSSIQMLSIGSQTPIWSYPLVGGDIPLPICDSQSAYVFNIDVQENGQIVKLDLLSGINTATIPLSGHAAGSRPICTLDVLRNHIIYAFPSGTFPNEVLVANTSDLSATSTPIAISEVIYSMALAPQANLPLLLVSSSTFGPYYAYLQAYSLLDYSLQWRIQLPGLLDNQSSVATDASHIYVAHQGDLLVYDFQGRLRQQITPGDWAATVIPAADAVFVEESSPSGISKFSTAASDLPPVWQGVSAKPGGGIRGISESGGDVTVTWDYATDDHGAPVRYELYWSADSPPDFANPTGNTHIVTDIMDTGAGDLSHSFTFTPGVSGRIYAGVRAADAPWDEPSKKVDANTNWLAVTPGWAREELVLGTDLPAGQLYFMRGATLSDGTLALLYNDKTDTHLTYVHGTTGAWTAESSGLASFPTPGFDLTSDGAGSALAPICDADAAVLNRSAPNTWNRTAVQGNTSPELNPQISLALGAGGNGALGYTEHIGGSFPTPDEQYYGSVLSGSNWLAAQVIDNLNFSGRDIALAFFGGQPTAMMQRGLTYAPNRLTPEQGALTFAQYDGANWSTSVVDSGDNGANSDCGKRVRAIISGTHIMAAYLDLNASAATPTGELKFSEFNGILWATHTISTFDLSLQPGSDQYTWGELGLSLNSTGEPSIGMLMRTSAPSDTVPHDAVAGVWQRDASSNWVNTRLSEDEFVFPADREPCVLLTDGNGKLHLFYASSTDTVATSALCDKIVHIYQY